MKAYKPNPQSGFFMVRLGLPDANCKPGDAIWNFEDVLLRFGQTGWAIVSMVLSVTRYDEYGHVPHERIAALLRLKDRQPYEVLKPLVEAGIISEDPKRRWHFKCHPERFAESPMKPLRAAPPKKPAVVERHEELQSTAKVVAVAAGSSAEPFVQSTAKSLASDCETRAPDCKLVAANCKYASGCAYYLNDLAPPKTLIEIKNKEEIHTQELVRVDDLAKGELPSQRDRAYLASGGNVGEGSRSFASEHQAQKERCAQAWDHFVREYPGRVYPGDRTAFNREIHTDDDIDLLFRTLELYKQSGPVLRGCPHTAGNYFKEGVWKTPPKDIRTKSNSEMVMDEAARLFLEKHDGKPRS